MTAKTTTRTITVADVIIREIERIYQRSIPEELKKTLRDGGYRAVKCYKSGKLVAEFTVSWYK